VAGFRRGDPGAQARRSPAARRRHRARASGNRGGRCRAARQRIRNAGAIFIGAHTPEAIGDYVAGSNHVLPTARSARFSSGLGVLDFMKRTSILKCGPEQLRALGGARSRSASGGLDAHARSVAIRLNR
jgi:histidinol dehydrogenase